MMVSSMELMGGMYKPYILLPSSRRTVPRCTHTKEGVRKTSTIQPETAGSSMQNHAITPYALYHFSKEGDTLKSIAMRYRTSMQLIAATNSIESIDCLPIGKILVVPTHSKEQIGGDATLPGIQKNPISGDSDSKITSTLNVSAAGFGPTITSSTSIYWVKAATSIVILTIVVAFGGKLLLDYFQFKVHKEISRRRAERKRLYAIRRSKLRRWQGALDSDRVVEDSTVVSADRQRQETPMFQLEEQEMQRSYAELESAYAKFLADCGMSRSGYWRDGFRSTSED